MTTTTENVTLKSLSAPPPNSLSSQRIAYVPYMLHHIRVFVSVGRTGRCGVRTHLSSQGDVINSYTRVMSLTVIRA